MELNCSELFKKIFSGVDFVSLTYNYYRNFNFNLLVKKRQNS